MRSLVAAVLMVLVLAQPVAAAGEVISIPYCASQNEYGSYHGTYLAGAGPWTITETWEAVTQKQIRQFLNRTTFKVWFDGQRVTGTWSAPYPHDGRWRTTWTRDTPAEEALRVKTRIIFNQRLTDGFYWYRAGLKGVVLVCEIYG